MEVIYKVDNGSAKKNVKVTCVCGECSLLSTAQWDDLREKLPREKFDEWPEEIKVIDN